MFRLLPLVLAVACTTEPQIVAPPGSDTGAPTTEAESPGDVVVVEVGDCDMDPGNATLDENMRPLPLLAGDSFVLPPDLAARVLRSPEEAAAWAEESGMEIDLSTVDFAAESVVVATYVDTSAGCQRYDTRLDVWRMEEDAHVAFHVDDHGETCQTQCNTVEVEAIVVAVDRIDRYATACATLIGTCD